MTTPLRPLADAAALTPVRRLELPRQGGCKLLPGGHGTWSDGGEARIAEIVAGAHDRSSTSDELAAHRSDWIEQYHLSPERANVVRCLDIPPGSAVLEVGAGCGAITRYLGEVAGTVDALEPTPDRAVVARARTEDLPGVEVFVGGLEALPAEPGYDLVVMVGVLEYVGGGAGVEPRVAFLREAAARLKPGGTLVCAIENQLGVKYLAGAPEDHVGIPFEGVDDYPRDGRCRTFPRRALEEMFRAAGLAPEVYHAFPDYKLPRLIFADALVEGDAAPLAWRAPRFPSPDRPLPRPRLANERRLWRVAVRAGLGGELANSFLVVGRMGESSPWPEEQRAIFWSSGRRARFSTVSRLIAGDGGSGRLERRYLTGPGEPPRGGHGLVHRCAGGPYLTGRLLAEILEDAPDPELDAWLLRWRRHAEVTAAAGGELPRIDVGPQNVIVGDERLETIDDEWAHAGYSVEDAIDRSLLHITFDLAEGCAPDRWPARCHTVRDLLGDLRVRAGLDAPDAERIEDIVRREAALQAQIADVDPGDPAWEEAASSHAQAIRAYLNRPLTQTALGQRAMDRQELVARVRELEQSRRAREAALMEAETQLRRSDRELYALKERFDALHAKHQAVIGSKGWRAVAAGRHAVQRLRRAP